MSKKKPRAASKRKSAVKRKATPGPRGKYLGHYGWAPDVPDHRDFVLAAAPVTALPPSVDLRPSCPPVYDQALGSCTANAIAGAIQYEQIRQKAHKPFTASRLFIYYNERVMEHTVAEDAGAQIRDGIKSVNHVGACPETDWPYVITNFAKRPPTRAYKDAPLGKAVTYRRVVQTLDQMRACLAGGYPSSWESRCTSRSSRSRSPGPVSCRCPPRARSFSVVTRSSRSATTTPSNASSCAIRGAPRGACMVISRSPTRT